MTTSIIYAIINIVQNGRREMGEYNLEHNRANSMGEALEEYVKDIFAGTINEHNQEIRNNLISASFSYLGNQNNPPDSIIRGGDAIEVKKIESNNAALSLNSSYPKAHLFANSTMITNACRNCEDWERKDIIYAVGVCRNRVLSSLCFVYGADYAASAAVYERIKTTIRTGLNTIPEVEFEETKELARVNRVDPLGITNLRVRGMWIIKNPMKVFNYVYDIDSHAAFNFMAIINTEKYNSFDEVRDLEILADQDNRLLIRDVQIKAPDNPASLRNAKLITFTY